uniref:Uncharacterized protein n=1 Tax=Arundo donax TaxID=35708 RepID=A0A0A9GI79_ARUDO
MQLAAPAGGVLAMGAWRPPWRRAPPIPPLFPSPPRDELGRRRGAAWTGMPQSRGSSCRRTEERKEQVVAAEHGVGSRRRRSRVVAEERTEQLQVIGSSRRSPVEVLVRGRGHGERGGALEQPSCLAEGAGRSHGERAEHWSGLAVEVAARSSRRSRTTPHRRTCIVYLP